MRITIDLDDGTTRTGSVTAEERRSEVEDTDGGPPPAELLEALAMEGALGPVAQPGRADGPSAPVPASAGPAEPVRGTWESSTLMRKRRD